MSVLQVFWPVYALVGAGFLVVAVVMGLSAASAAPEVIARGDAGQLTLPALSEGARGSKGVTVFAADPAGEAPPTELRCQAEGAGRLSSGFDGYGVPTYLDGERRLHAVARLAAGWSSEQVVRCPGTAAIAATTGSGPGARLASAGLFAAGGLGGALFAVIGRRSSRRRAALLAAASPGTASDPGGGGRTAR